MMFSPLLLLSLLVLCEAFTQTCTDCEQYCGCMDKATAKTREMMKGLSEELKALNQCEAETEADSEVSGKVDAFHTCLVNAGFRDDYDASEDSDDFEIGCPSCPSAALIDEYYTLMDYDAETKKVKRKKRDTTQDDKIKGCLKERMGKEVNLDEIYGRRYRLWDLDPSDALEECSEKHCGEEEAKATCRKSVGLTKEEYDEYYYDYDSDYYDYGEHE